jgi:hypothetical protein
VNDIQQDQHHERTGRIRGQLRVLAQQPIGATLAWRASSARRRGPLYNLHRGALALRAGIVGLAGWRAAGCLAFADGRSVNLMVAWALMTCEVLYAV